MPRIVCVSDLHLSDDFPDGSSAYEWFEDFLDAVYDEDDTDHLLVCGDLCGKYSDPSKCSDVGDFRQLVAAYGFGTHRKITVIPGNHDYLRLGCLDRTVQPRGFAGRMQSLLRGRRSGRKYPTYQLLDGVAIVGIDTIAPTVMPKAHIGKIDATQLQELENILALPAVKSRQVILAMHHGPFGLLDEHLYNPEDLLNVIDTSNVSMIVFGHDHNSYEWTVNGIPTICVGGFMHDDGEALVIDADANGVDWFWWKPTHWP